jgi:hypothetical protein
VACGKAGAILSSFIMNKVTPFPPHPTNQTIIDLPFAVGCVRVCVCVQIWSTTLDANGKAGDSSFKPLFYMVFAGGICSLLLPIGNELQTDEGDSVVSYVLIFVGSFLFFLFSTAPKIGTLNTLSLCFPPPPPPPPPPPIACSRAVCVCTSFRFRYSDAVAGRRGGCEWSHFRFHHLRDHRHRLSGVASVLSAFFHSEFEVQYVVLLLPHCAARPVRSGVWPVAGAGRRAGSCGLLCCPHRRRHRLRLFHSGRRVGAVGPQAAAAQL